MDVPKNASFKTKKQMRGSLVVGGHASDGRGGSKERTDLFMDSTRMLRYHMLRHTNTSRMESEIFIMTWYLTCYLVEYRVDSWSCGTCAPLSLLGLMMCQWWTLFFVEVASIVTLRTDLGVGYMYWWLRAEMVRGLPMILWTYWSQTIHDQTESLSGYTFLISSTPNKY